MQPVSELFWAASVEEIQRGFVHHAATDTFVCLVCGEEFAAGVIYPQDGMLHEAMRAVKWHIERVHGSVFDYLLDIDRQYTGLTDLQHDLLEAQQSGLNDKDIAAKLNIASTSTVRNHRFRLREREKQAKVFLAIMGLLGSGNEGEKLIEIPRTAKMVDERFAITEDERKQIIQKYFTDNGEGPLVSIPLKEKRKVIVIQHIFQRFEVGRRYTEKEVNEILRSVYSDFVTLRRLLIEYGYLDRERDCSAYWVKV